MQITDTQKKWAWIVGAVLLVVHFAPALLTRLHQAYSQPAPAVYQKPSPARPVPVVQAPKTLTPEEQENAMFSRLTGIWAGSAIRQDGTLCGTRLELQATPNKPGDYTGYTTRTCGPVPFSTGHISGKSLPAELIRRMTPTTTILSGPVENAAIHLKLVQSIATAPDGCYPQEFSLQPFGASEVAAQWTEAPPCIGGNFTMRRVAR